MHLGVEFRRLNRRCFMKFETMGSASLIVSRALDVIHTCVSRRWSDTLQTREMFTLLKILA